MRLTYDIFLTILCAAFFISAPAALAGWVGEAMCACPGLSKPLGNNATCEDACFGSQSPSGGGNSTPGYDYGAAERARQAEAERQRQQEADRIERERQAEIKRQKNAEFVRDRDAAAGTLKGSSGTALDQLKGLSGTGNSGLKGSFDTGSTGLKELRGSDKSDQMAAQPVPHADTSLVDARGVQSGLTKALDNAITSAYSSAPPGVSDRVRKGFQAVMDRDWKVAKAWFQDALKRDPDNAGLKRLVALADTSQEFNNKSATVDDRNEPAGLGGKSDMKGTSAPPDKAKSTLAAGTQLQLPGPDDMIFLFPGLEATTDPNLQLPDPDDIYFLFPGLEAMEDKAAQDYLFGLDPYPSAPKSRKAK